MNTTFHIPLEEYGYVEFKQESTSVVDAILGYREAQYFKKEAQGLSEKEFNSFIDSQLLGETNHLEDYLKMSPQQQAVAQCIKRALKRLETREHKHVNE